MEQALIWCAVIGAVAHVIYRMTPSYYEMVTAIRTTTRLDRLNILKDEIAILEDRVFALEGRRKQRAVKKAEVDHD